jgi:hypothetical protein
MGGRSTPHPGRFNPGKASWYPFYSRLSGPQGQSGRVRKISPTPTFRPWNVQRVAGRYTDWAIAAHDIIYDFGKLRYEKLQNPLPVTLWKLTFIWRWNGYINWRWKIVIKFWSRNLHCTNSEEMAGCHSAKRTTAISVCSPTHCVLNIRSHLYDKVRIKRSKQLAWWNANKSAHSRSLAFIGGSYYSNQMYVDAATAKSFVILRKVCNQ